MPAISIILPVYNIEQFLPTCLESISAQTFTDWECIVVDDGSTDSTPAICDRFAENDPRFRVTHEQHQGLRPSLNVGISLTRGQYIGFVDGDDYIHPEMYRILFEQIDATGVDFVSAQYTRAHQQRITFPKLPAITQRRLNREQIFEYWFKLSTSLDMWVVWNKLYTREVIGDERFANISPGGDQEFNLRIYLRCSKAIILNTILYNWQYRDGSITRKNGESIPAESKFYDSQLFVDFEKHTESMTCREKGYYYSRMMRNILKCRELATEFPEIKSSMKGLYRQFKKKYYTNSTIPLIEKLGIAVFWTFPWLCHFFTNKLMPILVKFKPFVYKALRR